jgi:hypothetical protein
MVRRATVNRYNVGSSPTLADMRKEPIKIGDLVCAPDSRTQNRKLGLVIGFDNFIYDGGKWAVVKWNNGAIRYHQIFLLEKVE